MYNTLYELLSNGIFEGVMNSNQELALSLICTLLTLFVTLLPVFLVVTFVWKLFF